MPSVPQSSLPTRAFLLTISTKGDISQECVKAVVKHISKTTDHAYVVLEHGEKGKLHLHAVLLYAKNRLWSDIKDNLWQRQVKPYHPDSIGSVAVDVRVCPGNDWYDNYLRKEGDVTVLHDTYDREAALAYFPTPEVQEALKTVKTTKGVACPWIKADVQLWSESEFENTPRGAVAYLQHRMYVLENMVPIKSIRNLRESGLMYWKYRNKIVYPTEREDFELRQMVDGPSFDVSISSSSAGCPGNSKKMWCDKKFDTPSDI